MTHASWIGVDTERYFDHLRVIREVDVNDANIRFRKTDRAARDRAVDEAHQRCQQPGVVHTETQRELIRIESEGQ